MNKMKSGHKLRLQEKDMMRIRDGGGRAVVVSDPEHCEVMAGLIYVDNRNH